MKTATPKSPARNLYLDNIGSAAVLIAAVLIVATSAVGSYTDSTAANTQVAARNSLDQRVVVATAGNQISTATAKQ